MRLISHRAHNFTASIQLHVYHPGGGGAIIHPTRKCYYCCTVVVDAMEQVWTGSAGESGRRQKEMVG